MYFQLTDHFVVAADPAKTWAFFSSVDNLPAITPPWLSFDVRTQGDTRIELDTILNYTIRWFGVPLRWRTQIIDWSPQRQFIDLQIRGPYRLWHHQHMFEPGPDGVECRDRVTYSLPLSAAGWLAHRVVVKRQLLEIFRYRRQAIGQHLGWVRALQPDVEVRRL